jgi:hypothetical protein
MSELNAWKPQDKAANVLVEMFDLCPGDALDAAFDAISAAVGHEVARYEAEIEKSTSATEMAILRVRIDTLQKLRGDTR